MDKYGQIFGGYLGNGCLVFSPVRFLQLDDIETIGHLLKNLFSLKGQSH